MSHFKDFQVNQCNQSNQNRQLTHNRSSFALLLQKGVDAVLQLLQHINFWRPSLLLTIDGVALNGAVGRYAFLLLPPSPSSSSWFGCVSLEGDWDPEDDIVTDDMEDAGDTSLMYERLRLCCDFFQWLLLPLATWSFGDPAHGDRPCWLVYRRRLWVLIPIHFYSHKFTSPLQHSYQQPHP